MSAEDERMQTFSKMRSKKGPLDAANEPEPHLRALERPAALKPIDLP